MNIYLLLCLVITLFLIGIGLFFVVKAVSLEQLRNFIVELIVKAEDSFVKGANRQKFEWVLDCTYNRMPELVKMFVSKAELEEFVQLVFDSIKKALDYQKEDK